MRDKGRRTVFRQILPGSLSKLKVAMYNLQITSSKLKWTILKLKNNNFEPKTKYFEATSVHLAGDSGPVAFFYSILTVLEAKFSKTKAVFFFYEFFIWLKGERAVFRLR